MKIQVFVLAMVQSRGCSYKKGINQICSSGKQCTKKVADAAADDRQLDKITTTNLNRDLFSRRWNDELCIMSGNEWFVS